MTKRSRKSFVGALTDDWRNRLSFIDGEFEEEAPEADFEPELVADETPVLKRAVKRKRRRKAVSLDDPVPKERSRTPSQVTAQREVTRKLNQMVDASVLKALPQIAVKLSQEARLAMKRASQYTSRSDIDLVAEYLRQTAATFERVDRERDAAHFRVLLISWLTEQGESKDDFAEALSLTATTERMLDELKDSGLLLKMAELKSEVRRKLRELDNDD